MVWPGTSMWNEKIVSADPDFVHFCETIRFFLKFASNGLDNGLKLYYFFAAPGFSAGEMKRYDIEMVGFCPESICRSFSLSGRSSITDQGYHACANYGPFYKK